eukprot:Plantae.Rhodophyta-Purpureofilum_apyrenoidigerum.ctg800.p1 GENE.Plantae.Rhodophyta-Purpureofilum_apyrenoidigerum.ctg800~~Plantae.Rhodophyta-Purpureofilum_apyrenoidigerum.ctg800.p1  ORF type:complete len:568 (-),score=80.28 Plantae.Rhodophyta-Purpureofilum_apyrenoidigerum.ctg800:1373-3076(-)
MTASLEVKRRHVFGRVSNYLVLLFLFLALLLRATAIKIDKKQCVIRDKLENDVIYRLEDIQARQMNTSSMDCAYVHASFTIGTRYRYALVEFTTQQRTSAMPLLSKSDDTICHDTETPDAATSDVQGYLSRSSYHFLIYEVINGNRDMDVFLYNFNAPDEAAEAVFSGTLFVTFRESKPCPRDEDRMECSGRGVCKDGICECGNEYVNDEGMGNEMLIRGRNCDTTVRDITEDIAGPVAAYEVNTTLFGHTHEHFVIRTNKINPPFLLNALSDNNYMQVAIQSERKVCESIVEEKGGGENTDYNGCVINYYANEPWFHKQWISLAISTDLDSTNNTLLVTFFNPSVDKRFVYLHIFVCDGDGLPSCQSTIGVLPILIPIICSALLAPIVVLIVYRIRFGPLTQQRSEIKLSKRQIEMMFPAIAYRGRDRGRTGSSASSQSDDEEQCTVCLCEYEQGDMIRRLPCEHVYHAKCLDSWITTNATCPSCRRLARIDMPKRRYPWTLLVARIFGSASDAPEQTSAASVQASAASVQASAASVQASAAVADVGDEEAQTDTTDNAAGTSEAA